jgi:hypothetical protein
MGQLVKCRACGKDVAKFAKKCPGCGAMTNGYAVIVIVSTAIACALVWQFWLRHFW